MRTVVALARGDVSDVERHRVETHLVSCAQCRARYQEELELSRLLRRLRDDVTVTPLGPDDVLIRAFQARSRAVKSTSRRFWFVGVAAAAVIAIFVAERWRLPRLTPPRVAVDTSSSTVPVEPFVSSLGVDQTSGVEVFIVNVTIPRGTLPLLGVAAQIDPPLEPVEAKVVIGADGMVRPVSLLANDIRRTSSAR